MHRFNLGRLISKKTTATTAILRRNIKTQSNYNIVSKFLVFNKKLQGIQRKERVTSIPWKKAVGPDVGLSRQRLQRWYNKYVQGSKGSHV